MLCSLTVGFILNTLESSVLIPLITMFLFIMLPDIYDKSPPDGRVITLNQDLKMTINLLREHRRLTYFISVLS